MTRPLAIVLALTLACIVCLALSLDGLTSKTMYRVRYVEYYYYNGDPAYVVERRFFWGHELVESFPTQYRDWAISRARLEEERYQRRHAHSADSIVWGSP